jgi:hypothetical protein
MTDSTNNDTSPDTDPVKLPGEGLLLSMVARGQINQCLEGSDLVPVHTNIYFEASSSKVFNLDTHNIDYIHDIFIIFDRSVDTDPTTFPFESIELSIHDLKVWKITGECAKALATLMPEYTHDLSRVVYRLPVWFSKYYNDLYGKPGRTVFRPYVTHSQTHEISVKLTPAAETAKINYTIGVHIGAVYSELRRGMIGKLVDYAIYNWRKDHSIIPSTEPATKTFRIPTHISTPCTDILFWASNHGSNIPIKYLRLVRKGYKSCLDRRPIYTEILCIHTAQLITTSITSYNNNGTNNVYLYSHLPNFLNTTKRLDNLLWEIELETPQTDLTINIYSRTWSILRDLEGFVGYPFLTEF